MRRFASVLVLALSLCLPLAAQQPRGAKAVPLKVDGDVTIIVKSVPFKVTAPAGHTLYDWVWPDNVKASAEDNVLTVSQCPKGQFVVRVRMTLIDFKAEKVTRETGEVEVSYGGAPPPGPDPPVPPVPPPDDPLVKELRDAYKTETSPDRAKHLEAYAALYRQAAKMDLSAIKTCGELLGKIVAASRALLPAEAIPAVRRVANGYVVALMPRAADAELTMELRQRSQSLFGRLGDALTEAGKL